MNSSEAPRQPDERSKETTAVVGILDPIVKFKPGIVREEPIVLDFGDNPVSAILRPAEGEQREFLLQHCAKLLEEDPIKKSSFFQFSANMVQLLGGKYESGKADHIESNQLAIGNDTTVNFYRAIKSKYAGVAVTSQGITETTEVDCDDVEGYYKISSPIPDDHTFYSPGGVITSLRHDLGQERRSFLQKTLNAFIAQKAQ